MPTLQTLVERHDSDKFVLLGVNTGDSEDTFREKSKEFNVTWTSAYQGTESTPIADLYQVVAYPSLYVLDAEGRIRFKDLRGEALLKAVEELLAE
ncbi:MAG: hypothetical protein ACI8TQ_001352 [Planctomycetota bacterium]|jgi:hypothetical protein